MPDKILLKLIEEHLPYEVDMLRGTYQRLCILDQTGPETEAREQQICRHALIEAFCIHGRALLDFFSNTGKGDDALAQDFTNGYIPPFDQTQEPLKSLRTKLNKQIFHLTKNRAAFEIDKFSPSRDAPTVLSHIEGAIDEFRKFLNPEFRHFKCNTARIEYILTVPQASATSSVIGVATASFPSTAKGKSA